MKKIIISVAVLSQIMLWGCGNNTIESMFTLDKLKEKQIIKTPIDSPRMAVEVLKQNDKIDIVKLEDIEGEANSNILVTVMQKDKSWDIKVKTRTAIPSYSCEYAMDEYGKPTQGNDYIIKKCGWDK